MAINSSKPYTYLIGWSNHNKYYYGARYALNCDPSDLWKTYFTSSEYVKDYVSKYGDPDIIQVRRTFNSGKSAMLWESRFLKKVNAMHNDLFLNKQINGNWCMDEETRLKISNTYKSKNIKRSDEFKKNISDKNSGRVFSEQSKLKMSLAKRGKVITDDHKKSLAASGKEYWDRVKRGEIDDTRERHCIRVEFEGIVYDSYTQAMKMTGRGYYTVKKYGIEI